MKISAHNSDSRKKNFINGAYVISGTLSLLIVLVGCGPSVETVERTTDQAKLANIAVNTVNCTICGAAIEKLTDQALLAKFATKGFSKCSVREVAVKNLTDQTLLLKIAIEDEETSVGLAAVDKLSNQAMLAKVVEAIANEIVLQKNLVLQKKIVHDAAFAKLTDQTLLAKIAAEDNYYSYIHKADVMRITDHELLAKIAIRAWDREARQHAVSLMTDRDLLAKLAIRGTILPSPSGDQTEYDHIGEIARIRLFLTDPLIKGLLGRTSVNITWEMTYQEYGDRERYHGSVTGESISFCVRGEKLQGSAISKWLTQFPEGVSGLDYEIPAHVDIAELISKLLRNFSQNDILKLAMESKDIDIRRAAVDNLTDQNILATIAIKDENTDVRNVASTKLFRIKRLEVKNKKGI